MTTAGTVPMSAATVPARNSPASLEMLMKTLLAAETRPRISSGVHSWTMVWRIVTPIMSIAPMPASASVDSQTVSERPKTTVRPPKPPTAKNIQRPTLSRIGRQLR